jgi:hypothetical protein
MWVFIRPRGGQESYLLVFESRGCADFCPIHRFDGLNQIPLHYSETSLKKQSAAEKYLDAAHSKYFGMFI